MATKARLLMLIVMAGGAFLGFVAASGNRAMTQTRNKLSSQKQQAATEKAKTQPQPSNKQRGTTAAQRTSRVTASSAAPAETAARAVVGNSIASPAPAAAGGEYLPFPPTPSASTAGLTMQDSVYKQRANPKRLPADAPNILIILIDDAGPGLPSTFGGEVHTPTLDRVHKSGISYNRFHSTAMCSPTRSALLTGRNHTRV
jgi:hypothetical protein